MPRNNSSIAAVKEAVARAAAQVNTLKQAKSSPPAPKPIRDGFVRLRILTSFVEAGRGGMTYQRGMTVLIAQSIADKWIADERAVAAPEGGQVEQSIARWGMLRAIALNFALELSPSQLRTSTAA